MTSIENVIVEYIDVATGKPYYFNSETGETRWNIGDWQTLNTETKGSTSVTCPSTLSKPSAKMMARASRRQSQGDCATQMKTKTDGAPTVTRTPEVFIDPTSKREYYIDPVTGKSKWGRYESAIEAKVSHVPKTRINLTVETKLSEGSCRLERASSLLGTPRGVTKRAPRPSAKSVARASHNLVTSTTSDSAGEEIGNVLSNTSSVNLVYRQLQDPNSGRAYYFNPTTNETLWQLPPSKPCQVTWLQLTDPSSNRFYYLNSATNETVWEMPSSSTGERSVHVSEIEQNNKLEPTKFDSGTQRKLITNVFVARQQVSAAVIANAMEDLEQILDRCEISDEVAFRNALKASHALAMKYARQDALKLIENAMQRCPSPRSKSNPIVVVDTHSERSQPKADENNGNPRSRSTSMIQSESELETAIQVALSAQTNLTISNEAKLDLLRRAQNLGHDLLFTYSVIQIRSEVLRGLKEIKELITQLEPAPVPSVNHSPETADEYPGIVSPRNQTESAAQLQQRSPSALGVALLRKSPTARTRTRGRAVAAVSKSGANFSVDSAGIADANGLYFEAGTKQGVPFFTNEQGYMLCRAFVDLADLEEVDVEQSSSTQSSRKTFMRSVSLKRSRAATVIAQRKRTLCTSASPQSKLTRNLTKYPSSGGNTCFVWVIRAPGRNGAVDAGQGSLLYGVNSMDRYPPSEHWEVYRDNSEHSCEDDTVVRVQGVPPAPRVSRADM